MRIRSTEPTAPQYIHITPVTNMVHLMVPIVSGQEISTDNTCKSNVEIDKFFKGGAQRELNAYKEALISDIQFLEELNPQRQAQGDRLAQIEAYIEALAAMQNTSYISAKDALMGIPSNLYGIQLRPQVQDPFSTVLNPAFNVKRDNNDLGEPLSRLYNEMHKTFPTIKIGVPDPRTILVTAVLAHLPDTPTFAYLQSTLSTQFFALYGLTVDFTLKTDGTAVTQEYIDTLMKFDNSATAEDYIEGLLGACAPEVWGNIPTPLFYNTPAETPVVDRTERLSILTQFFLGIVNIYCRARNISARNFGTILDASPSLSKELVGIVANALSAGEEVEDALCTFFNAHQTQFGLSRPLSGADVATVKEKFNRTYRTVTATKENPHMDDFMIMDLDATGETAKFVIHQGAICTDFTEMFDPAAFSVNAEYFQTIRADFVGHPVEIPHKNESVEDNINIEPAALLERITHDQLEKLIKKVPNFLTSIVNGDISPSQAGVDNLLGWAITFNNHEVIEKIIAMTGDNQPSQQALDSVLKWVLRNHNRAIVEKIIALTGDNKPSQASVNIVLNWAATYNHPDIVEKIIAMTGNNKPSQQAVNSALEGAHKHHRHQIIEKIIAMTGDNKPSQQAVDDLLVWAHKHHHHQIIEKIITMTGDNKPSQQAVNSALEGAAQYKTTIYWPIEDNSPAIVKIIISMTGDNKPSQKTVDDVLAWAAVSNHPEIVEKIIAITGDNKPSQQAVSTAFYRAAINNCPEIVEKFIAMTGDNKPSQKAVDNVLAWAAGSNHPEIVEKIIPITGDNQPSQQAVDSALKWVLKNQNRAIVEKFITMTGDNQPSPQVLLTLVHSPAFATKIKRILSSTIYDLIIHQIKILQKEKIGFFYTNKSRKQAKIAVLESFLCIALRANNREEFRCYWQDYKDTHLIELKQASSGIISKRTSHIIQQVDQLLRPTNTDSSIAQPKNSK